MARIQLLELHLQEEEKDFFPKARALIESEEVNDLAVAYARERDDIFAKKSGFKPVVNMVYSNPH